MIARAKSDFYDSRTRLRAGDLLIYDYATGPSVRVVLASSDRDPPRAWSMSAPALRVTWHDGVFSAYDDEVWRVL